MSNVYNMDDKILHIESLQITRTPEIYETREEAVDAILNYCGDETMDGMPLLSRYWSDSGHTEIKHVRGYIHFINGDAGISVDDICDVDLEEIYEYIEQRLTASTETINIGHFNSWQEAHDAMTGFTSTEHAEGTGLIATYDNIFDDGLYVMYGTTLDNGNGVVGKRVNPNNVIYWQCNDGTGSTHDVKEAFSWRNGVYKAVFEEFTPNSEPGNPDNNTYWCGHGGERMEKHDSPMVYVTPVQDERRLGKGPWYGVEGSKNSRVNDQLPGYPAYYSMLTILSLYKNKINMWDSHPEEMFKGTIIDPKRYERKIHQAIHLGGRAQSRNDNYVVKKPFPVFAKKYYMYYYAGNGIQFELPPVPAHGYVELRFESHFFPFNYQPGNFIGMLQRTTRSGFYDRYENGEITINFVTGDSQNVLTFHNNGDYGTYSIISITMEYRTNPSDRHTSKKGMVLLPNGKNRCLVDGIQSYAKGDLRGAAHRIEVNYGEMFKVRRLENQTFDTTTPGFRVESGKLKCYRKSELPMDYMYTENSHEMNRYLPKKVKDGTVFFFNRNHAMTSGLSPKVAKAQHEALKKLIVGETDNIHHYGRYRIYKEDGVFEYAAPVRRGRTNRYPHHGIYCEFVANYVGFDSSIERPIFRVTKEASTTDIVVKKIGVSFIGTDGMRHTGYFRGISNNSTSDNDFPAQGGEYDVWATEFYILDESTRTYHAEQLDLVANYGGSMKVIYMKFEYDIDEEEMSIKFVSADTDSTSTARSRTKWRNISKIHSVWLDYEQGEIHGSPLARGFEKSYFNRCRYYQKFKGVKSEFPEYFYTR